MCEMQSIIFSPILISQLFGPTGILWAMERYCAQRARCKSGKVLHGAKAMQVPPGAQVRAILSARLGPFEFKTGPIWVHIAAGQAYFSAMALFTARRSAFLRCNICQADEGEVGELEQIGFNCMHCLFTKGGVALQIIVSQYIWWLGWIFKSSEK